MRKTANEFYLILVLLFIVRISVAQTLPFRNYSEKDGLPDSIIQNIYQDSRGYLWFGQVNNLSRFNGIEFRNYSKKEGLSAHFFPRVMEDRDGNFWMGTTNGEICRFEAGQLKKYTSWQVPGATHIYAIAEGRDGMLWFGTDKGLVRFDGKEIKRYTTAQGLKSDQIGSIVIDGEGRLWLATSVGLSCFANGTITNYTTVNGLVNDDISTLYFDSEGKLWIGTKGGISCFSAGKFVSYTTKDGLCHNKVCSIIKDRSGNTWIGTWNGVSLLRGKKFRTFTTANGLVHNFVYTIVEDRQGNIWFGTEGGISCLKSLNITTYSVNDGLVSNAVSSIKEDRRGRIWIGTHNGINCFSGGKFKSYKTEDGLVSNGVNDLMEDRKGNIWIATIEGISVFPGRAKSTEMSKGFPGNFTNYTMEDGLSGNIISKMCLGRDGTIWIANYKGIDRFMAGTFSTLPLGNKELKVSNVIEDSNGNLWFYTLSPVELYRVAGDTLTRFSEQEGLSGGTICSFFNDAAGNVWFVSDEGLSCFHEGKFVNYYTEGGFPGNKFIIEDKEKNLWMGKQKGLLCFNRKSFRTYTAGRLGLTTVNWSTGLRDSSGKLWFGGQEGLVTFRPPPVEPNRMSPPIYITRVKVMDKEVSLSRFHGLDHNQNYIRFEFEGLCYNTPESIRYKYRLEGADSGWQETANRSIFYYLQPGNYRFLVKAVNSDGVESVVPAELSFSIFPAFWQTWWFKSLSFLFALSLVGLLFYWRYRQVRDKSELKTRTRQLLMAQRMELMGALAAGTIHDLKNLLAIIMGYSKVIGKVYDKDDKNYKHIEIIKKTADTAMHMVRQILSFSRLKTEISGEVDLVILMDEILKTLDITRPASICICWAPPAHTILLDIFPARFQQLVMNLCLNAVYAMPEGGELAIAFSQNTEQEIILEISDTGTGIKPDIVDKIFEPLYTTKEKDKGTGLGLFVVKQIVEEHNGKIVVESELGKGTTFTIIFPPTMPRGY
ncbi:MAG: hypothetical protein GY757_33285 [bacterium]|nr:hypothetical protein [bacterium]